MGRFDLPGVPWGKIYKRELFEKIRFPKGYICFEDTIIHFLVFRTARRVVSIADNVYMWRKNPTGITENSQNSARAIQSYWIMEELGKIDEELKLPHDDMYALSLTCQLSNFCYANVSGMSEEIKKSIFTICCENYENALKNCGCKKLPYAVRLGARALS